MNKFLFGLLGICFAAMWFVSCDESDGVEDLYANWEERNQRYIDSIAAEAKSNPAEWKVIHTYKYPPHNLLGGEVDEYVYCKILKEGNGAKPLFTDSVSVNYRGQLMPFTDGSSLIFDQSYLGELDADVALPTQFAVSGVIEGWATALQSMKEGDRWVVYIPSALGYGEVKQTDIPANSTLVFDIDLVEVIPLK